MSSRAGFFSGVVVTLLICGGTAAAVWLAAGHPVEKAKAAAGPPPATVAKPLNEEQLNAVTLTAEAVARLNLSTGVIEERSVTRTRGYAGEVTVPAGQALIVSAPLSGVIEAASTGVPKPGQGVEAGEPIFHLLPILTPEARTNLTTASVEAAQQVKVAQTQVEATQIALDRARRVFQSDAGSRRAVDEAEAQHELAARALEAARARHKQLQALLGEIDEGTAAPITIKSPETGLVRNVSAMPGQNVATGAPLFEIVNIRRVWVRVPVYVGDLSDVDAAADATVDELTARPGRAGFHLAPVAAPPSANPSAGTADLYYELDNTQAQYRPGQRVAVTLPLKSASVSLTAPWSSIVHDIYGGTWLYVQTAERTYVRRRVAVQFVKDDLAVLASGPPPGTTVVTAGAAELFGTETGFTK